MDAAMAATIALKEQTKNRMNFETGYLFCHVETKRTRNLGCGSFFVLELVGFEQVGRPQTAKNSPADCFLDRGLRIHQLPPKSCGKDIAAAFFL